MHASCRTGSAPLPVPFQWPQLTPTALTWGNLRHKSVRKASSEGRLEGNLQREVGRRGKTSEIDVSDGIEHDATGFVVSTAAEIGRIHNSVSRGIEQCHEDVVCVGLPGLSGLDGIHRGEIGREAKPHS